MNLENSMVIGAQRAYEAACPEVRDDALDEVAENLATAIHSGDKHPLIEHARICIEDCALDDPIALWEAVKSAERGDTSKVDELMKHLIRAYAEAHLTTLGRYFNIVIEKAEAFRNVAA
jgi:hypothetical protein